MTFDMPEWVHVRSGSGTSYDPALIEWKQEGSFVELKFPYEWVVDVFGDGPFLVLVHSEAPPEQTCGAGPTERPDCFVAGWRDVLPVVRITQ